jgi:membrane associated rhomboid family serine protease
VKTRAKFWNARQPTLVTYALIAFNVAVYLWTVTANQKNGFGQSGHGDRVLALDKPDLQFRHEYYRLISSGFLHFGLFHVGMNMLLLFQVGQLLEPALGRVRFSLLYFASLLGGSLGALMLQPNGLTGGASGAVFGLMAAAAIGMHRRGINVFRTGIGTILVLNLVITFTIPGISVGGHLGGIAAGAICGFVILAPSHLALPAWASYITPIAIVVGVHPLFSLGAQAFTPATDDEYAVIGGMMKEPLRVVQAKTVPVTRRRTSRAGGRRSADRSRTPAGCAARWSSLPAGRRTSRT